MDLATLISTVNQNTAQTQQTISGMKSSYGAAIAATGDAANQIKKAGLADATIKTQEAKGTLEAQTQARRMATANGTNLSASNEILTLLGDQQRQQALDVSQRASRVDEITKAANLGNPFGMLFDIFYGDSERANLESGKAELDATTQSIQALNQATQTTAITQKAIAETTTEATVAATEELALAQAAEAVADKRVKMASLNAQMLGAVNTLNNQQLSNAFRIWQAEESSEQRAFMREQRAANSKAIADEQKSIETTMEYYNTGAKALGIPQVTTTADFKIRQQLDKNTAALAMQKGYELMQTGKLSFGNTPLEALSVSQNFRIQVPPVQQPVFNKLATWTQEFETDPGQVMADLKLIPETDRLMQTAAYNKMKPEEKAQTLNNVLNAKFRDELANVRLGDPTNIAALPPIDVLQGSALLDSNPFIEKYIKPDVVSGGGIQFEPGKYIQMAEEAIASGEITTSQAAEGLASISKSLYTQGVLSKGFTSAFGLPEISEYSVVVDAGSSGQMFSGGVVPGTSGKYSARVDILDEAEWNSYLSNYLKKRISSGILGKLSIF